MNRIKIYRAPGGKSTRIFLQKLRYSGLIWTVLLFAGSISAQKLELVSAAPVNSPVAVSIDRLNNIYIADKKGNLNQYVNGVLTQTFSPQKPGSITLVEAWNPLKIFVFYTDFQEYLFLDRFLTSAQRFNMEDFAGFSGLATISNDNNLWLVDYTNFGLRKYDIGFRQFTIERPFDLILDPEKYEITFIREYQNLVFISDSASGILVFDNMGNYLRKISAREVNYFSFKDDYLYYLSEDSLVANHIYSSDKKVTTLPEKALFALPYNQYLALITEDSLKIYRFSIK